MLRTVSIRRVVRALPEIAMTVLITLGLGMTIIALLFAAMEVMS
jgi:hypothetical protein